MLYLFKVTRFSNAFALFEIQIFIKNMYPKLEKYNILFNTFTTYFLTYIDSLL
jgi:hypothetical protein